MRVLVAALLVSGAATFAAGCGSARQPPSIAVVSAKPAGAAAGDLREFALFRRAGSGVTAQVRRRLVRQFASGSGIPPALGVRPARARAAYLSGGRDLVVVLPGRAALCLQIPDVDQTFGGTCAPVADARDGHLVLTAGRANPHGRARVVGFVPDGVRTVQVRSVSGAVRHTAVVDNLYEATVIGPSAVVFADRSGAERTISIKRPG